MVIRRLQHAHGKSYGAVVVGFGLVNPEALGKNRRNQFFGGGFPHASRHADRGSCQASCIPLGKFPHSRHGIGNHYGAKVTARQLLGDALTKKEAATAIIGALHVSMSIYPLAHRHPKQCFLVSRFPRVGTYRRRSARSHELTAAEGRDLFHVHASDADLYLHILKSFQKFIGGLRSPLRNDSEAPPPWQAYVR